MKLKKTTTTEEPISVAVRNLFFSCHERKKSHFVLRKKNVQTTKIYCHMIQNQLNQIMHIYKYIQLHNQSIILASKMKRVSFFATATTYYCYNVHHHTFVCILDNLYLHTFDRLIFFSLPA